MRDFHIIFTWLAMNSILLLINASSMMKSYNNEDASRHRIKRAAINDKTLLWPNATIPYIMDDRYTHEEKDILFGVLNDWVKDTCIRFVEWDPPVHKYFVFFEKTHLQLCYSYIGLLSHLPMPQSVFLHPGCFSKENRRHLAHEIGHLFGFFHEHNRPDRDKHIKIVWENVAPNKDFQFDMRHMNQSISFNSPYDLGSLMQYPLNKYSKDEKLPTMIPRRRYKDPIGTNTKPSRIDIQQLNYLYGCIPYIESEFSSGSGSDSSVLEFSGDIIDIDIDTNSTTTVMPTKASGHINHTTTVMPATTSSHNLSINHATMILPVTASSHNPSINHTFFSLPVITNDFFIRPSHTTQITATQQTTLYLSTTTTTITNNIINISSISSMTSIKQHYTSQHIIAPTNIAPVMSTMTTSIAMPVSLLHKPISSIIIPSTTTTTTKKPTVTISISSEVTHPLPTVEPDGVLLTGQAIGLKTQYSPKANRYYWLTCTNQRCRPRLCPGKTFSVKKQQECITSIFTFKEPRSFTNSPISVGDSVVLLPYHEQDHIVKCSKDALCKNDHLCYDTNGTFKPYCAAQILTVSVPGKNGGMRVMHGDLIELKHYVDKNTPPEAVIDSWIGCDPLNTRKCKRFTCSGPSCNHEAFEVFIL